MDRLNASALCRSVPFVVSMVVAGCTGETVASDDQLTGLHDDVLTPGDDAVRSRVDAQRDRDTTASFAQISAPANSSDGDALQTSRACNASKWRAGDTRGTINVAGANRTYLLHVPTGYEGKQPVPLLVDLHGLGGNGAAEKAQSGFAAVSDREKFVVVYPDGVAPAGKPSGWNIGLCCSVADDQAFIRALVEKVKSEGCIDEKRVYATGVSMGGGMSYHLACNAADVFAAVAPAAFDLLIEQEMPCKPSRPISVISYRGTADPLVKYAGGASNPPGGGTLASTIHFEGAENTFKRWGAINGCAAAAASEPAGRAQCRTYGSCRDDVEVTLCALQGGSHVPWGDANYAWTRLMKHVLP